MIKYIKTKKEQNMTIYYIHGFNSSANSDTLKLIQKTHPTAIGLTYDHTNPEKSLQELTKQINSDVSDKIIIGSSLGGWYTEQLTNTVVADFILYNPCTEPDKILGKFDVSDDILLKYFDATSINIKVVPRYVILSADDAVISPKSAYDKYKSISDITITTGGHRMTDKNMDIILDKIKFIRNQLC